MKLYNNLRALHKLSKIFQPINVLPKNAKIKKQDLTSNSQRVNRLLDFSNIVNSIGFQLMLDLGIIRQANPGCFHFLPLGMRALEKLTKLVDIEMSKINAQKIILSTLTHADLWKKTGRLETGGSELFILKDRHNKKYVLSPTHEESVTELLSTISLSYKQFPLRVYQITNKYRDEIKPRFGLMRGRQFVMKDLYTFDTDMKTASETYEQVCNTYDVIFDQIGVRYVKVLGTTGNIGGSISNEYHFPAEIGEDRLFTCASCKYTANVELAGSDHTCPQCNSTSEISVTSGIEVGHTFLLGDKYSKPLNATYLGQDGKSYNLQMGCYGLGLSRILAASIEVLSNENEIRWPLSIAPYSIIIIPPKAGSNEEPSTVNFPSQLYSTLANLSFLQNDIILDDRTQLTIGKRVFDAKRVGYPFIIIIGSSSQQNPPLFELHDLESNYTNNLSETELFNYLKNKCMPERFLSEKYIG